MEYVTLKSYDGKMVRVPFEKKDEYIRNQRIIKACIEQGKGLKEIRETLKDE